MKPRPSRRGNYKPAIVDSPIAHLLRDLRAKSGNTIREVAAATGVTAVYITRLEVGHCRVPIADNAVKLAAFYKVDPAILMGFKSAPCHDHTFRLHLTQGASVMYGCMCGAWYIKNLISREIILKSNNA